MPYKPMAYALQPMAYALQPMAYALQPTAYALKKGSVSLATHRCVDMNIDMRTDM